MAGLGVPQDDIAAIEKISTKTLRKYYSRELESGVAIANLKVAQSLFQQATAPNDSKSVTAAIFWLKTRAKWRERHDVNLNIGSETLNRLRALMENDDGED